MQVDTQKPMFESEPNLSTNHPDDGAGEPARLRTVITASAAGAVFEWYDFFLFGALAGTISKVFFSGLSGNASYLAALGIFATGFAFRPLGALVFGRIGDRVGRKGTFLVTISLMGFATVSIGLLPSYAQAGALAPILLVSLRALQGFALGGEFGGAAIYVAEHAPASRRGISTSVIQTTGGIGLLLALVVIIATRFAVAPFGTDAFDSWGWRLPFLFSAGLVWVALIIRFKLSESPAFARLKAEGNLSRAPLSEAFARGPNLRKILIALFALIAGQTCSWYTTFFYTQTFFDKSLHLSQNAVLAFTLASTVLSLPLYVFFGWVSDRIGRKPVMVGGLIVAAATYFPAFFGLASILNPAISVAERSAPVTIYAQQDECSLRLNVLGRSTPTTPCDAVRDFLSERGVQYRIALSAESRVTVGSEVNLSFGGSADWKSSISEVESKLAAAIERAGYTRASSPSSGSFLLAFAVLAILVVATAAVYGPLTACLVELFPTRIRYTALSVPYHLGTGWIGGFLPFISFAIVTSTGSIFSGLWYPFFFTALSAVLAMLFLPETRGQSLDD